MVQLHSLMVLYSNTPSKKPVILCGHTLNSSWFGWMYKDALTEFAMFVSKLLASKVKPGQRIAVKEQKYVVYAQQRSDFVTAVLVADESYPSRVAFDVVKRTLDQLDDTMVVQPNAVTKDFCMKSFNAEVQKILTQFQDPSKADNITKVKKELDDIKGVMLDNIEKLLSRGETIDSLVDKSDELSTSAKMFYKTARKNNSCCTIL